MKTRFRLVGVAGLAALAAWVWSVRDPEPLGDGLLVDRLWVERMPEDDRDMIGKLAIVRSVDHGRFGVAERGSVWRHRTEVFQWTLSGDRLDLEFPQDRVSASFRVRTWACEGDAPEPFELCLEVRRGERKARFYSRRDWKLRPRPGGDDILEPLVPLGLSPAASHAPTTAGPLPSLAAELLDAAGAEAP